MRTFVAASLLAGMLVALAACTVVEPRPVVAPAPPPPPIVQNAPELQERIQNQQRRIDHGISSGELTRGEADILQDNLNYIKGEFSRLRSQGALNPRQVARLEELLDRNNRMIYNKKHNPIVRIY